MDGPWYGQGISSCPDDGIRDPPRSMTVSVTFVGRGPKPRDWEDCGGWWEEVAFRTSETRNRYDYSRLYINGYSFGSRHQVTRPPPPGGQSSLFLDSLVFSCNVLIRDS